MFTISAETSSCVTRSVNRDNNRLSTESLVAIEPSIVSTAVTLKAQRVMTVNLNRSHSTKESNVIACVCAVDF